LPELPQPSPRNSTTSRIHDVHDMFYATRGQSGLCKP
jgi:hypothetical protein